MNFLAHQYLSWGLEGIRVGNFLGDFRKGKSYLSLDPDIIDGVELHREIDWFTDNHPVVKEETARIRDEIGRYGGVALDLFFDHFLANHFNRYSSRGLTDFSSETYRILEAKKNLFSEKASRTYFYMSKQDWLSSYRSFEGISQAFYGISRRARFPSRLDEAPKYLKNHTDQLERSFVKFFPDLISMSRKFLEDRNYRISVANPLTDPDSNSSR